jgi:thiol-disulfide isomerase/thioredoxin
MSIFGRHPGSDAPARPSEGRLPGFDGATGWLNSPPLSPKELRGKVVLVDFWTYTCINWLRTLGYVRAWAEKYAGQGLVVIGVHTPEFPFERDVNNVRWAIADMNVRYPVALDPDYGVWQAFSNHYWPAVYIADAEGQIRYHHYGEGAYDDCERVIQQLLDDAGAHGIPNDLVAPELEGFEVQADWANLESPETYLGSEQASNYAPGVPTDGLELNQWTLVGDWAVERWASVLNGTEGSLAFRFHARDVNLVMGPPAKGSSVPFRVVIDGEPPGHAHGFDVDEQGRGSVTEQRLYQLVREPGGIADRTFEISFDAPGAEAYCFTFG